MRRHPIQNTEYDGSGVICFAKNKIVRFLLDNGPLDLNQLYIMFHEEAPEDYEQLMQLIGYSLSGFGDLCDGFMGDKKPCKMRTLAAAERKKPLRARKCSDD